MSDVIPEKMKAYLLRNYGEYTDLEYAVIPIPSIRPNEVLVRTSAIALNPLELHIIHGKVKLFGFGTRLPKVIGSDIAGEVVQVGSGVSGIQVGDRIAAMVNGVWSHGVQAEYIPIQAKYASVIPNDVADSDAAAVSSSGVTAYYALHDIAKLQAGQHLLINGASGGVGTHAVQVAKILGATVTAVCSGENEELVRSIGADDVINYKERDFTTEDQRFDMILDLVGNISFAQARRVLTKKGTYITSVPSPWKVVLSGLTRLLPGKRCTFFSVRPNTNTLDWLLQQVSLGAIQPAVIDSFPFSDLKKGYEILSTGHARGKIVITIRED